MEKAIQNLIDEAIKEDFQNTLFDIYEQETGLEPVPEDGGHTDKFEDWFVNAVYTAYLSHDCKTLDELKSYFNIRRDMRPDHSIERTNELAFKFANYGMNAAKNAWMAKQMQFAAECFEMSIRLMQSSIIDEINSPDGETTYTESQLIDEWKRLSREAKRLSK